MAQFAQERNVPFTNFASLCRAREVQDLIWGEIERVNKGFARVETIKKFRLIEQILTPEDEELTPTMKLKRTFVNEKYKDVIDGMYERRRPIEKRPSKAVHGRSGDLRPPVAAAAAAQKTRASKTARSCSACTPTCRARPAPTACRRPTP